MLENIMILMWISYVKWYEMRLPRTYTNIFQIFKLCLAQNDHKVYCEDQIVYNATIYVYKEGDH